MRFSGRNIEPVTTYTCYTELLLSLESGSYDSASSMETAKNSLERELEGDDRTHLHFCWQSQRDVMEYGVEGHVYVGGASYAHACISYDMSLLDCICCPEHVYRTAVVSDDLKISSAETYGFMMERASILACYLRKKFNEISGQRDEKAAQPDRVVAILSESCSEALSAIVGILAVPASFMPLSCGKGKTLSPSWSATRGEASYSVTVMNCR